MSTLASAREVGREGEGAGYPVDALYRCVGEADDTVPLCWGGAWSHHMGRDRSAGVARLLPAARDLVIMTKLQLLSAVNSADRTAYVSPGCQVSAGTVKIRALA